jgi:hypothetical protein
MVAYRPGLRGPVRYRLHDRPAYHYHYRYTDEDQAELEHALSRAWPNWVLATAAHLPGPQTGPSLGDDIRRFAAMVENGRW